MRTKNWTCVYRSVELIEVKLAEDLLKQHAIESHIVIQRDSAIPALGETELYVRKERAEEARRILKKNGFK